MPKSYRRLAPFCAAALLSVTVVPAVGAQEGSRSRAHVTAGNPAENYLRALQLAGLSPLYPWSLRAFSARELDHLAPLPGTHPWAARYAFGERAGANLRLLPFAAEAIMNTGYPWGMNEGAVWAGRGATVAASAGVAGRFGSLTFAVNPVAFHAANTAFDMAPNGQTGPLAFGDPLYAGAVDRPQRFGDAAYSRVDPGQSYLRLDIGKLALGVSTANEWWGPAARYPLILGNNAPGFLHAFLGTSTPVDLWFARAHARVQWGRLEQSLYSPVTGPSEFVSPAQPGHSRFAPGLAFVLQPRGADGLEIGFARFFHFFMPEDGGIRHLWLRPFSGLPSRSLEDVPADYSVGDEGNQLFSLFARWVFAPARFEVYAEYGKEDYNADTYDLLQEPDHARAYMLGFAKAMTAGPGRLSVLRAELVNHQMSHLERNRPPQGVFYMHSQVRQGHTHRGKLLGSAVGVGSAAASTLSWETYTAAGKWEAKGSRILTREFGDFHESGQQQAQTPSVAYEVDFSALRFTRLGDITVGAGVVHEFNRYFADDPWNLRLRLALQRPF